MLNYSWLKTLAILPIIATLMGLENRAIAVDISSQTIPNSSQISSITKIAQKGDRISVNGRIISAAWIRWAEKNNSIHTGISDVGLMQAIGLDLLNSDNPKIAPVAWFNFNKNITTKLTSQYRYLDITNFAKLANFQIQVNNNTLVINSPIAKLQNIQIGEQSWGNRIFINIDRPTPWQVNYIGQYTPPKSPIITPNTPKPTTTNTTPASSQVNPNQKPTSTENTADDESKPTQKINEIKSYEWNITLDAKADAALIKTWQNQSTNLLNKEIPKPILSPPENKNPIPVQETPNIPPLRSISVENIKSQTNIRLRIPPGWRPQVTTLDNPNRLIIDIRPDHIIPRDIIWAPGVRWRQEYITVGTDKFAAVWLEINPKQKGISFKPINSNATNLIGTIPLVEMASQARAAAAINGGFFNRNIQQPLGAIRRDGIWLSSPILNRGAIGWNNQGEFIFGRLALQETLTTSTAKSQPILSLNSGYIQAGIARYTPEWGKNYTPLSNNEIIVTVQNNQVTNQQITNQQITNQQITNQQITNQQITNQQITNQQITNQQITNQQSGNEIVKTQFPIPNNGYILVLRSLKNAADMLQVGTSVQIESVTIPADFNLYPHIISAGPMLLQNGQIVLDAKIEGFNNTYIRQTAVRSVIGRTVNGNIIIAAIHNRPGGAAATFAEVAAIIKQLGAVDALNFDGGSSTALYLGGQIINRPANAAARVHNGLGVFIQSIP